MRISPAVELMAPERQQLAQWARGRRTPARLVLLAKIVLLAATDHDNHQIAAAVATSRQTVGLWRHADHDSMRHGTTTLFAALHMAKGAIISTCQPRHWHQEWLLFLRLIDRQIPQANALHLIVDNYATHKHPTVQRWLIRHPRVHRTRHPDQ